jgi:hypothetical protein
MCRNGCDAACKSLCPQNSQLSTKRTGNHFRPFLNLTLIYSGYRMTKVRLDIGYSGVSDLSQEPPVPVVIAAEQERSSSTSTQKIMKRTIRLSSQMPFRKSCMPFRAVRYPPPRERTPVVPATRQTRDPKTGLKSAKSARIVSRLLNAFLHWVHSRV